ncbi:MAG: sulfur carrier protein ThiS [Planctomycetota bacterium]|jgi:sulfur carrier protein
MVEFEFNGTPQKAQAATTIRGLLESSRIESRFCAVEVNEQILPKDQYDSYRVQSGDRIEVVTLVGGG